ncbi:MAG TPA: discoidin domain-containing protein, partial [Herpetosiphonaceae bacterium]
MVSSLLSSVLSRRLFARTVFASLCCALIASILVVAHETAAQTSNLALNRPVSASSVENGGTPATAAVDGNTGTRWSSAASDPQWISVDLGAVRTIGRVVLRWEAAYGRAYQIQVSNDGSTWTNIYSTTTGDGGVDDLTISGSGRYLRMYGTQRATGYGYSLWELEVYAGAAASPTPGTCGTSNVALNRPATTLSTENAGTPASAAVDGNTGTRWSSAASDPQWLRVDLGTVQSICKVTLRWEAAYGRAYQIQVSNDGSTWTNVFSTTTGDGGVDDLTVSGSGRYVRMYGTQRATGYGYSLWELEVFVAGTEPSPTPTTGPVDFGPNVAIFDPSMSSATIQAKLNSVFATQERNQFGMERNALLFKPGTYSVDANIGFNTQIAGLGFSPDAVTINGYVRAEADWFGDNGTQNFWRFAENMSVTPPDGNNRWAVSQAAPFRRMHVRGQLQLDPRNHGWSSGGFLADSKIDGQVFAGSQQQYMTRNSQIGSWSNCVWNCVFVGVSGAPAQT